MDYELNIYHEIADSDDGWFTDSNAMTPDKFSETANECKKGDTLNIHVNSPGGSVFAAVTMTSIIKALRNKGVTVNAYVDGLAASAASFLVMACSNVYCYTSSMLMIHKPMSFAFGNADDMIEVADTLEKIEASTCMPMYMEKAKVEESEIRELLAAETWLSAKDAEELFEIEIIEGETVTDSIDASKLMMFKNVPVELLKESEKERDEDEEPEDPEEPEEPEESEEPEEENPKETEQTAPDEAYFDILERTIKSI